MKKFFFLITLFTVYLYSQNPNLGTSGAQFLQIPVGARASAMGSAAVGLADDASSVFWNPAGIVNIKSVEAHFSYMKWFTLFDFNAASLAYNIEDAGVLAASLIVFSTDEMEITTEESPNGTGRYFDAQDIALGISFARYLTDRFSVGLTVKYISQNIWNEIADGVAFDIGTQYRLDFQNLIIAMSMQNFGADLKFDGPDLNVNYEHGSNYPLSRITPAKLQTEGYSLPLNFQVGIGFDIYNADFIKIKGALDAVHPNDNDERLNFGTEFSFFDRIFLRGGYKFNYDDEDFTFGAGANIPFAGTLISFDYAYSVYDILPSVHRVSLGIKF
ncbi:MAG TPA: PorV/PorQ family protein [Ignavibacteriaceae bacterium]|nr:PorV/PorQ family protein [Ignavibacteriaceae bacterium]